MERETTKRRQKEVVRGRDRQREHRSELKKQSEIGREAERA